MLKTDRFEEQNMELKQKESQRTNEMHFIEKKHIYFGRVSKRYIIEATNNF